METGKRKKGIKIMFIIMAALLVVVMIAFAGIWDMFGEKIKAAKSIYSLEDGLYYLEYKGDYGFDAFLEQGGAESDADMAVYITEFLSNGFYHRGKRYGSN